MDVEVAGVPDEGVGVEALLLARFSSIDVEFIEAENIGVSEEGDFDSCDEFEGTSLLLKQIFKIQQMRDLQIPIKGNIRLIIRLPSFLKLQDQSIEEFPEVRDLFGVTLLEDPQRQRIIHLEILRHQRRIILRQGGHSFPYLPCADILNAELHEIGVKDLRVHP